MSKNEDAALKVLDSVLKVPFVKVDRKEFLMKIFKDKVDNFDDLINNGPSTLFSKEELDKIADKVINAEVLKSSSLSFASGLPGGFTMAATVPADMAQFYAYTLRLAQEISYIYGYDNILNDNGELTEDSKNTLLLYLGVMFGVTAAGSSIRLLSGKFSQQLLKTLPRKALTKTAHYPIIKKVLRYFGVVVTKKSFSRVLSKAIPLVGGAISGGINYVTLNSLSQRLKAELSKIVNYSEEDLKDDIRIVEAEFSEIEETEVVLSDNNDGSSIISKVK